LTEDATNERLAVWRAEFDAHDARGTGRLDLELATFALAKLRLLEDLDVSLAARTLETRLAETAGGENEVALDFEAFARFATALETARLTQKRSNPEAKIAQPVPVRKEYALDDAHPFHKLFREMADSRGEMDGETFACVLRAARLTDDARLTDTGVDVVFARARARHQAERTARRVPYRIFLGALSLAAGHLGVDFETAAARVGAGAEAARARARRRAPEMRFGTSLLTAKRTPSRRLRLLRAGGGRRLRGRRSGRVSPRCSGDGRDAIVTFFARFAFTDRKKKSRAKKPRADAADFTPRPSRHSSARARRCRRSRRKCAECGSPGRCWSCLPSSARG
jgi:hypothetical protein